MMPRVFAVEMQGITKRFGNLTANNSITIRVQEGSIHAVVGENGAGKSTLMKILYGMLQPDEGSILLHGQECVLRNPSDAIRHGIAMVHQHFMLIPPFSVLENIVLGSEPVGAFGFIDTKRAIGQIEGLSQTFHLPIDPHAIVATLSVGMQQRVEILKILYREAGILIYDEPTGVLTPQEIDSFFATLKSLQKEGKTVLLITHKLSEILEVSDEITVLRAGAVALNVPTSQATKENLSEAIIGRSLSTKAATRLPTGTQPLLSVRNLSLIETRHELLRRITFTVKEGEILGIAGVEGSGQTPLVELLAGIRTPTGGTIEYSPPGKRTDAPPPVAHIPEDRHNDGLILDFSVEENFILGRCAEFSGWILLDSDAISTFARESIRKLHVHPPGPGLAARYLSGGNQQKIIIGRELSKDVRVIIAHQPTRGLDIGAKEFVHEMLMEQRNAGKGVVLVSSDLAELLTMSDRIAVMYNGTFAEVRNASEWTERALGTSMTGMYQQSA